MRLFKLPLLMFVLLLLTMNCSTGPDFERDHYKDPKSQSFRPALGNLQVKLNNDKTVSLNWKDNSGFEDGIVIAKSLGKNGGIEVLDTLSANQFAYVDDSKLLSDYTAYHIGAFKNEANPVDTSFYLTKKLDFGEIQGLNYTSEGNTISLNWESSIPYADKYLITKNNKESSPVTIDTVDGKSIHYSYEEEDESYTIDITLSALILNYKNELVSVTESMLKNVVYNNPSLTSVNVVNEAIVGISIKDNSDFDDKFIVYERARSAWDRTYSEFIPIDTISASENVFIPKNRKSEREYAIEGIYKNETSGLSEPIEIKLYTYPPHLGEDMFTPLSSSSIKITWEDVNFTESSWTGTYHFELDLYNSESGELIRQIIIPATKNEYILENLNPSLKYEFLLKTYNSYTPEPIAFSIQTALEEVSTINLSQNDGVNKSQIIPDRELIVFSPFQSGSPGLRVYDLKDNSYQYIYDTDDNPNDYENTSIEDFTVTEDLNLIATNRTLHDDQTGKRINWLHVVDLNQVSSSYFKSQGPDNNHYDETHIVGFSSDSELIYVGNNEYEDDAFKMYKWNFRTDETEIIFEREYYNPKSTYLDSDRGQILLGSYDKLLIIDHNGNINYEIDTEFIGSVKRITKSSLPNQYNLNIGGTLYRYEYFSSTVEKSSERGYLGAFFEVPSYNYIIGYFHNKIVLLDINSGSEIYAINDFNRNLVFSSGVYLPNQDQIILQHDGLVKTYNLINSWVTTNWNCC